MFRTRAVTLNSPPSIEDFALFSAIWIHMQASQDVEQPQDIAPVDQEQESQTENPAEPMDAESQAANEQLALLQAIPELMEKVAVIAYVMSNFSSSTLTITITN